MSWCLVDDASRDDGGQQAHNARNKDGHEDGNELKPVGRKIAEDSLEQLWRHLGRIGLLFLGQKLLSSISARCWHGYYSGGGFCP